MSDNEDMEIEYLDQDMTYQIGEITDYLCFGSVAVACNEELLKKNKITHILNISEDLLNYFPDKFKYKKISIDDSTNINILEHFDTAFNFILEAKNEGGKCFAHCRGGISRSSTIMIGYYMKTYGKSLIDSIKYVKEKRNVTKPNEGFISQLIIYEKILKSQ